MTVELPERDLMPMRIEEFGDGVAVSASDVWMTPLGAVEVTPRPARR